jgi:hypothetical protein
MAVNPSCNSDTGLQTFGLSNLWPFSSLSLMSESRVTQAPQAHPQFCAKPWARRGGRFLRTPRRWFLPRAGGLQPRFLGSPSIPPSFAERHWMPPGESSPAGIPHPSLSPPGNPGEGKLGVGKPSSLIDNFREIIYIV